MPTEYNLKDKIHTNLQTAKKNGLKIWWLKVHGHQMQRVGVADFLVCFKGRFYAPELKRIGELPTPAQKLEARDVLIAGGVSQVVYSWDEFCDLVGIPQEYR